MIGLDMNEDFFLLPKIGDRLYEITASPFRLTIERRMSYGMSLRRPEVPTRNNLLHQVISQVPIAIVQVGDAVQNLMLIDSIDV